MAKDTRERSREGSIKDRTPAKNAVAGGKEIRREEKHQHIKGEPGLDTRHRDPSGTISAKRGDTLVSSIKDKSHSEDYATCRVDAATPKPADRERMTAALAHAQAVAGRPDAPPFDGVAFLRTLR